MFDFYSATIFLSVFIMIIMDMLVSGNDLMEHDKKQTVYTISVLAIACMVSEWFGVWMDGADPSLRTLHILVKTIELSTAPIITVLCSDLMTPLKHKKLIYTLIGIHAGLEVLSAFFGFIFSVDAQNVYHHETFYWVYVLAYASGGKVSFGIPARADGTASEKRAPAARVGRLCVLQSGARQRRGCDQTRRPDDVPLQAQAQKRSAHK